MNRHAHSCSLPPEGAHGSFEAASDAMAIQEAT